MNEPISTYQRNDGFSLVELMIAMLLGLFIIGGVISVFLSNRVAYRQNENLARMQESARYAFEVVGRDIREVGGIACGANLAPLNTLTTPSANWWSSWNDGTNNYNGIRGFEGKQGNASFPKAFGTAVASRVEGADDDTTPDALIVQSATSHTFVITAHDPVGTQEFSLNTDEHEIGVGDVLMACDYSKAALFSVTAVVDEQISHSNTVLQTSQFLPGGQLSQLSANAWYIGFNGRGGRSLYRIPLAGAAEEIAEGVIDLQIQYLAKDASGNLPVSYVDADSVTNWSRVIAIRLIFTLQSLESLGTDSAPLQHTWNTVISLRNRQL